MKSNYYFNNGIAKYLLNRAEKFEVLFSNKIISDLHLDYMIKWAGTVR